MPSRQAEEPVIERYRPSSAMTDEFVWEAVNRLLDGTSDFEALRAHRLHLLAGRRWRELGEEIPTELAPDERLAAIVALLAPELLRRVVSLCDTSVVLHKGPEIAARYPDPALRPCIDLDVLVEDAESTRRALLAAGLVEVGDPVRYAHSPHGLPLAWPGIPLFVEVHSDPNWPSWLGRPPTAELLDAAVPSALGVEGLKTLAPVHHALIVAVHAWTHGPMARAGDLVDLTLMAWDTERAELLALARRWGLERLLRTTLGSADAVLFGGRRPRSMRVWARNVPDVRERTVLETHMGRWLAGFSALGARRGAVVLAKEVGKDLRPLGDETWGAKLRRTRMALGNARVKRSVHDKQLEHSGHRRV